MDKLSLPQRLGEADAKNLVTKFSRIYTDEFYTALEQHFGGDGFMATYEAHILPAVKYYPDTRLEEAITMILDRPDDAWAPFLSQVLITPFTECHFTQFSADQQPPQKRLADVAGRIAYWYEPDPAQPRAKEIRQLLAASLRRLSEQSKTNSTTGGTL